MGPHIHMVVDSVKEGENYTATAFWHLGNLFSVFLSEQAVIISFDPNREREREEKNKQIYPKSFQQSM